MNICINCGHENDDSAKFCKKCGTKLNELKSENKCKQCGSEIKAGVKFCTKCGAKLESDTQTILDEPSIIPIPNNETSESDSNKKSKSDRKPIDKKVIGVIIGILVIVAIIGILFATGVFNSTESTYENSAEYGYESDSNENSYDTSVTSSGTAPSDIEVLSSDWDWDSANGNTVDVILYVANEGSEPITSATFTAYDEEGYAVETNGLNAYGYVPAGKKAIMVASVAAEEYKAKGVSYNTEKCNVTDLDDYIVPSGKIIRSHGDDNDYYDVELSNKNDESASTNSYLVAVYLDGNKIVESDATGSLSSSIAAQESGFVENDAFFDPHFYHYQDNKDKYVVYVIDMDVL